MNKHARNEMLSALLLVALFVLGGIAMFMAGSNHIVLQDNATIQTKD